MINTGLKIAIAILVFVVSFLLIYFPIQLGVVTTTGFLGLLLGLEYEREMTMNISLILNVSVALIGTGFLCYLITKWVLRKFVNKLKSQKHSNETAVDSQ